MQDYSKLPEGLQDGMRRYVEDSISPGSFLRAVLENNLFSAVFRADDNNIKHLTEIVRWVYWEIPMLAWGSPEDVDAWIEKFKTPSGMTNGR